MKNRLSGHSHTPEQRGTAHQSIEDQRRTDEALGIGFRRVFRRSARFVLFIHPRIFSLEFLECIRTSPQGLILLAAGADRG